LNKGKTDNTYLGDKIKLRMEFLPRKRNINVLDLFAGDGLIWGTIKNKTKRNINITSIDKKEDTEKFHLIGDNRKYLPSLNLKKYDVIDIDSYGIPYDQIDFILKSNFIGEIFMTCIKDPRGPIPMKMALFLGYTEKMYKKCPTLISKNHFNKLKKVLTKNGIFNINYIEHQSKYYYINFKKEK